MYVWRYSLFLWVFDVALCPIPVTAKVNRFDDLERRALKKMPAVHINPCSISRAIAFIGLLGANNNRAAGQREAIHIDSQTIARRCEYCACGQIYLGLANTIARDGCQGTKNKATIIVILRLTLM